MRKGQWSVGVNNSRPALIPRTLLAHTKTLSSSKCGTQPFRHPMNLTLFCHLNTILYPGPGYCIESELCMATLCTLARSLVVLSNDNNMSACPPTYAHDDILISLYLATYASTAWTGICTFWTWDSSKLLSYRTLPNFNTSGFPWCLKCATNIPWQPFDPTSFARSPHHYLHLKQQTNRVCEECQQLLNLKEGYSVRLRSHKATESLRMKVPMTNGQNRVCAEMAHKVHCTLATLLQAQSLSLLWAKLLPSYELRSWKSFNFGDLSPHLHTNRRLDNEQKFVSRGSDGDERLHCCRVTHCPSSQQPLLKSHGTCSETSLHIWLWPWDLLRNVRLCRTTQACHLTFEKRS